MSLVPREALDFVNKLKDRKSVKGVHSLMGYLIPRRAPSSYPDVRLRHTTIIGYMESGKTTLALTLARKIEEKMEELGEPFMCYMGDSISDFLNIDFDIDSGYILLIVDDAPQTYLSRNFMSQKSRHDVAEFFKIRHTLEEKGFQGVLGLIFCTQFFRALDVFFRNAPLVIFKSLVSHDIAERREIARYLGRYYYRLLRDITQKMFVEWNDSVKSLSIAVFPDGIKRLVRIKEMARPKNLIVIGEDKPTEAIRHVEEVKRVKDFKGMMYLNTSYKRAIIKAYAGRRHVGTFEVDIPEDGLVTLPLEGDYKFRIIYEG